MDVVINSVSESVTEGSNLLNKDVDNPFKVSEFHISSVFFLFIENTESSKSVLSVNNVLVRLSGELPSIGFSDEGDFEVNSKLLKVSVSLLDINFESGNFSLGLDLEGGGIKGGLDLVLFEKFGTIFEVGLESGEHSVDLVVEGTNEIGGVDGGFEFFGVEFISVGVLVTIFFSSGGGFIKIFEVFKIGVGIWDFYFTGLEELFHGVSFEEMFVFGEFSRERGVGLSKDWGITGSFGSGEFNSEDTNGDKGVFVFLKLLDEKLVGFTSGDVELDELGSNGGKSVIDPLEMVVRVLDLGFNPFSVLSGIFGDFSVSVGNSGKVGDGLGTVNLLLSPTSVVVFLFLVDRIFEFKEELFDGVDGIRSHSIG